MRSRFSSSASSYSVMNSSDAFYAVLGMRHAKNEQADEEAVAEEGPCGLERNRQGRMLTTRRRSDVGMECGCGIDVLSMRISN